MFLEFYLKFFSKMNYKNLAVVFTPQILRPQLETVESTLKLVVLVDLVELLIHNCKEIMVTAHIFIVYSFSHLLHPMSCHLRTVHQ